MLHPPTIACLDYMRLAIALSVALLSAPGAAQQSASPPPSAAVVRWDYRSGSSVYFVWQQQRSDFEQIGDFATRRDVSAIFRTVPTNVFLVKATYWMGS